jgi:protein-disulfide isomerase
MDLKPLGYFGRLGMARNFKLFILFILCSAIWTGSVQSANSADGNILGGSLNSPIKLEVFSDFQCPSCREFYLETIRRVLNEYSSKNQVCVIYHEFPLNAHRYSRAAAGYVTAAARMGRPKLLSVMEALFIDQAQWSQNGNLDATLSKVLSPEEFKQLKKLARDSSINASINSELQLGAMKKVESTPTMFITQNGKEEKVTGKVIYPVMKQFLDRYVK